MEDCVIDLVGCEKPPDGGGSCPRQKVPKSNIDPFYPILLLFLGEGGFKCFSTISLFLLPRINNAVN